MRTLLRRLCETCGGGRQASFRSGSGGGLVDLQDLIGVDVGELLQSATGPTDFDGLSRGFPAETEVDSLIAGGEIAASGGYGSELRTFRGGELYLSADGVAIGFVADEIQR